ncbi:MAG TPA: hypothetical protein PK993_03870 [Clostridia bacterium]|nr:hypothetical protein [Clostridia bacterium]
MKRTKINEEKKGSIKIETWENQTQDGKKYLTYNLVKSTINKETNEWTNQKITMTQKQINDLQDIFEGRTKE